MAKLFVLRRPHDGSLFTCNNQHSIVAFRSKMQAQQFMCFVKCTQDTSRPHPVLKVHETSLEQVKVLKGKGKVVRQSPPPACVVVYAVDGAVPFVIVPL